jgi:hypothetical protein
MNLPRSTVYCNSITSIDGLFWHGCVVFIFFVMVFVVIILNVLSSTQKNGEDTPCQIEGLDVNQSGLYIMDRGRNTT